MNPGAVVVLRQKIVSLYLQWKADEADALLSQSLADARKEGREGRDRPGLVRDLRSFVEHQAAELAQLRPLVEALDPIANYKPVNPGDVVCIDWESYYAKVFEALAKYRASFPR